MNWKLCAKFILITSVVLSSAAVWAQGQSNITCINQFYHNWGAAVGDVAVQGDYVYLACQEEGLRIVDITDYNSPIDVAHLPITRADVVTVAGNYAYVGSWVNGVQVIDISNPASPQEVHSVPVDRGVNAIRIEGNHAFICSPSSGLIIMNIANPSTAYVVWNSTDLPGMQDIDIHGSIAYAVTNNDGMFVLDISDLSSPQILDTFQVDDYNYITGCSISDGYAYLSCGWSGLRVVNLSTMEAVAQIDSLYYAYAVKVQNGFAYVHYGDFDCPIAIVDIANPSSPQTLGIYYPPQDLLKFTMKGNLIYVADAQHGLRIVDASDPRDPIEIAHYSRYGRDTDVTVKDNIAYVREDMKLKMIDISDMQHPIELGYFEMNWNYGDAEIVGNTAYLVTHGYTCLYAVDISN
ncbi:hypothetical protein KKG05_09870, partial [bacterium]|nr:hypothetical protein [bacterium]